MDSAELKPEERTPDQAPLEATTANGDLNSHPNSMDLKSNGISEKPSSGTEKPVDSMKGKGLKKWRRIKRDFIKEGSADFAKEGSPPDLADSAQTAQMHKRRIPLPDSSRSARAGDERDDVEGESSVASVESRSTGFNEASNYVTPSVPSMGPEVEHNLMINGLTLFSIGAVDSDNSEDRSSKSSTATSAPRARYDYLGFGRERGRHKGSSGFNTSQRAPRIKGDAGRKNRSKAEAENSNSNALSNGKHSDKSVNYDGGENSDEGLQGEEVRSGYCRENGGMENSGQVRSDGTCWEGNGANDGLENPGPDPFVESIMFLQTAQEALETEISKFVEIENETRGESEEPELSESPDSDFEIRELNEKISSLESKLEAAAIAVMKKDLKIGELEQNQIPSELVQLFQEKMEAEINSLVISKTMQKWKRVAEDQNSLYKETKSLSLDHKNVTGKLRETENENVVLKERVKELETESKEKSCTVEVLNFKNLTCETSFVFFLELVLMVFMAVMFIVQLLPPSSDVVPT